MAQTGQFFEDLVGSYKTVIWNGQTLDLNDTANCSRIEIRENNYILAMDYSKVMAVDMMLFMAPTPGNIGYSGAYAFLDYGSYYEEDGKHVFNFDGQVRYRIQPQLKGTLHHKIEVQNLDNGDIWVHNYIHVDETPVFNVNETFVLRPSSC